MEKNNQTIPKLGDECSLPPDRLTLVTASQIIPSTNVRVNGSDFEIGVYAGRVAYLWTATKGTAIPSGEIVGVTTLEEIKDSKTVIEEKGFAYVMPRRDGWHVAWENNPSDSDPIEWVFKRDLQLLRSGTDVIDPNLGTPLQ